MLTTGVVLFASAALTEYFATVSQPTQSGFCSPHCSEPATHVAVQDAGWVGMGVGASLVVGGLTWFFLQPAWHARVSIAPMITPQTGGLSFRATF